MVSKVRRAFHFFPRLSLSRLAVLAVFLISACVFITLTGLFSGSRRFPASSNGDVAAAAAQKSGKRYADYQVRSDKVGQQAPGENGQAVVLHGIDKENADKLFKKEAFNIIASDMISLQRSLPDVRDPK